MAELTEIDRIIERRRQLLAESARLRGELAGDVAALSSTIAWIERGYVWGRSLRVLWPVFAAGAGFWLTRRRPRHGRSIISRVWGWWQLVSKAASLWKRFGPKKPAPAPAEESQPRQQLE